jgi:hypothetical protein
MASTAPGLISRLNRRTSPCYASQDANRDTSVHEKSKAHPRVVGLRLRLGVPLS